MLKPFFGQYIVPLEFVLVLRRAEDRPLLNVWRDTSRVLLTELVVFIPLENITQCIRFELPASIEMLQELKGAFAVIKFICRIRSPLIDSIAEVTGIEDYADPV